MPLDLKNPEDRCYAAANKFLKAMAANMQFNTGKKPTFAQVVKEAKAYLKEGMADGIGNGV
jgi:hypothetical protein